MMTNKWIQAVLWGGFGLGILVGSFLAIFVSPIALFVIGWMFMVVSLWKTANCRGTDGWGNKDDG